MTSGTCFSFHFFSLRCTTPRHVHTTPNAEIKWICILQQVMILTTRTLYRSPQHRVPLIQNHHCVAARGAQHTATVFCKYDGPGRETEEELYRVRFAKKTKIRQARQAGEINEGGKPYETRAPIQKTSLEEFQCQIVAENKPKHRSHYRGQSVAKPRDICLEGYPGCWQEEG